MFDLPKSVDFALNGLKKAGFEAFIVGGCVRDILRGKQPSDYDITTSAEPEQTKEAFKNERIIETGLKHGTITLLKDGNPLEITTYRIDGEYADNRRPDNVTFTKSLKEDLARRDFTINAMAYSKNSGVVDLFGGKADLENKIIRSVGDPDRRFNEDALRIMRALRFASVLGFKIDDGTKKSIIKNRNLLKNISAERIAVELLKLITGENAKDVILEYIDVLGVILPEIKSIKNFDQKNPHHIYDVLTHTAIAVENTPPEPALRLAILLHDCGKPDCFTTDENKTGHFYGHPKISYEKAKVALSRLKLDNATTNLVLTLVKYHDVQIEPTEKSVKRALNKYTPEVFFKLLEIKKADNLAQNPEYNRIEQLNKLKRIAESIINKGECFSLKDLAVNGNDLINIGLPAGKKVGETLKFLLDSVINNDVENKKEALLAFFKEKGDFCS
ncbi:MAG: HD domain-containing protein [Clostridia bacterium]|nr:HD domain-containing protein [Clostridia bacterium]